MDRSAAQFIERLKNTPPVKGGVARLIFAVDATSSETLDHARHIQGEMFEATTGLGGFEVKLVFYRGASECKSSRWVTTATELQGLIESVHCSVGPSQVERVLNFAIREARDHRVNALVFVIGGCLEERIDRLCYVASALTRLGVPIFAFHEGYCPKVAEAFKQIAALTQGGYLKFDFANTDRLKELLGAVAVYAAGGHRALSAYSEIKGLDEITR